MALRTANIIGSGPNGLAAAVRLAQAGVRVTVFEKNAWAGGAVATREWSVPGFRHDVGASAFPMAVASPFFRSLALERFGLRWIEPDAPLAHPLDDGTAVMLEHALDAMPEQLGVADGQAWKAMLGGVVRAWPDVVDGVLGPLLAVPRHPVTMAGFGAMALLSARTLARMRFDGERAQALFAGCAAHAVLPLTMASSAGVGMVLAAAGHATGWPVVAGGAGELTRALVMLLESLGGELRLGQEVSALADLPEADATFFDTGAEAMARIAGGALTPSFQTRLRHFKRGPGIFKIDWALREEIPWRADECKRAATVHVGGTLGEIVASEEAMFHGRRCEKPFVLVVQPSLFDRTRAPEGQHTAWGYCHVPKGFAGDMTAVIEAQMERFAPGFRECVLARVSSGAAVLEAWNANLAGGDICGGAMTLGQLVARPTLRLWRTSTERVYLCSASTPPGGGVHGMCGFLAAEAALAEHGGGR